MEKTCKHCKKKVSSPVDCEICTSSYHPSCAAQAKVVNRENVVICCRTRDRSEVREQKNQETLKFLDMEKTKQILKKLLNEALNPIQEKLQRDMEDLKTSVQFMSDSFEEQKAMSKDVLAEVKLLRDENQTLKRRLEVLEQKMNIQEQKERQNNIIVTGIPAQENEDTKEVMNKVLNTMKLNVQEIRITDCFRLKQNKEGPILVKLPEQTIKMRIIKKIKELRGIKVSECGLTGINRNIFLNEDLTVANQKLFKSARDFKKENKLAAAYCRNGEIYLRKTAQEQSIRIRSVQDLIL